MKEIYKIVWSGQNKHNETSSLQPLGENFESEQEALKWLNDNIKDPQDDYSRFFRIEKFYINKKNNQ